MADRAALFTLQQKAAALVMGGAVLIVSPLIRDYFVDKALLGQTLQLPVHRGKPHLLALGMQLLRQLRSRGAPLRTAGNILQHRPLLAGHIRNRHIFASEFENENQFQIIAGSPHLSILFCLALTQPAS